MNRLSARAAAVALALPFATGVLASNASALEPVSTTVPGCYGAGPAIYCDLTLSAETPEPVFATTTVPVCVGPCYDVPVTTASVKPGSALRVCYSYKDKAGYSYGGCVDTTSDSEAIDLSDYIDLDHECVCPPPDEYVLN